MRLFSTITRFGPLIALLLLAGFGRGDDGFVFEPGFKSLFNGTDLSGWRLDNENLNGKSATADRRFVAKDGVLVITGAGAGQPPMTAIDTLADYNQDFVLRLEFRASRDANGGVRGSDGAHAAPAAERRRTDCYAALG